MSSELVRRFAGESPDYYDVQSNKWFNTDAGSELVTNGTLDSKESKILEKKIIVLIS